MTEQEQKACELQGEIFELSFYAFKCGSSFFIAKYMNSDFAKHLDRKDDNYNYIEPHKLMMLMAITYKSLNEKKGKIYPEPVLRWMGYIYRAYSIIKNKKSNKIYKLLKADELLSLYDSFHTYSIEYAVDRLEEIINEKKSNHLSDYEIFKMVMDKYL